MALTLKQGHKAEKEFIKSSLQGKVVENEIELQEKVDYLTKELNKLKKKVSWEGFRNFLVYRSSNVNEVIRAVLNSFFFTKRFRAHKRKQKHVTSQNQLTKRIKTSKRMKIVCFVFLYARRKENRKKEKIPHNVDVLNTDVPTTRFM